MDNDFYSAHRLQNSFMKTGENNSHSNNRLHSAGGLYKWRWKSISTVFIDNIADSKKFDVYNDSYSAHWLQSRGYTNTGGKQFSLNL